MYQHWGWQLGSMLKKWREHSFFSNTVREDGLLDLTNRTWFKKVNGSKNVRKVCTINAEFVECYIIRLNNMREQISTSWGGLSLSGVRFTLGLAPTFFYRSGTLILSTRLLHPHFFCHNFLHQRDIPFSLVHFHSDIR